MAYQCGNRKITIRALIDDRAGQTSSSGVSEAVTGVPSPSTGNSYNKKRRYENDISNIASLTHSQQNWTIKAKVEEKSDKKPWSNKNGNGHCFSMALSDNSGKIRAVAFNDQCHKFYEMIQEGKIYTISKFDVKLRKKEFRTFNDYEIVFRNDTQVAECLDVGNKVRKDSYEFVKIKDIQAKKTNTLVDVIGICKDCPEIVPVKTKNGKEVSRRELTLVDDSGACIKLTLWDDDAKNIDEVLHSVICVKNARIKEYRDIKSLGIGSSTCLKINPDLPEATELRGWFDKDREAAKPINLAAMLEIDINY